MYSHSKLLISSSSISVNNISKEKFSTPSDCIAFPIKDFALGFLCSANLSSGFRLVTPI